MFGFPAGSAYHKPVVFLDEQGTAVDLTGATLLSVLVYPEPREGQAASLTLAVGTGLEVATGTNGEATLVFADDDLAAGEYTYTASGTLASGDVVVLGRGWFRVY